MKTTIFNSNQILDEENWVIASQAFKRAFDTLFDPNQMRASGMLAQNAADTVTDTATAAKMLGENVDTSRQMSVIFDKLDYEEAVEVFNNRVGYIGSGINLYVEYNHESNQFIFHKKQALE